MAKRAKGKEGKKDRKSRRDAPRKLRKLQREVEQEEVRAKKKKRASSSRAPAYASKGTILPLVKTLRDLTANQRTLVLAHLDDKTLRTLCRVVGKVLHSGQKIPTYWKTKLVSKLSGEKCAWRRLCSDKLSDCSTRKHLLRMGGSKGFRSILHTAIPLYSARV